jgi:hypothetical protein
VNRIDHHIAGALAGLALAAHIGGPWWRQAGTVAVTTAAAGGSFSPDIDQTAVWRTLDRWIPDELLGHQGPMRHRGITHWWGVVVALAVAASAAPPGVQWVLYSVTVAWASHLVGDWIFGAAGWGRGAGIPWMPWWAHHGLGLRSGGLTEMILTRFLVALAGLAAVWFWSPQWLLHGARAAVRAWGAARGG